MGYNTLYLTSITKYYIRYLYPYHMNRRGINAKGTYGRDTRRHHLIHFYYQQRNLKISFLINFNRVFGREQLSILQDTIIIHVVYLNRNEILLSLTFFFNNKYVLIRSLSLSLSLYIYIYIYIQLGKNEFKYII